MKASNLLKTIRICRAVRRPLFIWGKPGVGKSSLVAAAAKLDGCEVIDWRLALMDAVDLMGIPKVEDGMTRWNPPAALPRSGKGYLFLDEFVQSSTSTSNAATQLILDRRLGDYVLPEGWVVIAAGNLEGDRAATNRMATHVANRFIHVTMSIDTNDWLEWAEGADIDPRVFSFIKYRPELLHQFDPKSAEKAFASPRSWEFLSQIIKETEGVNHGLGASWESEERLELAAGVVGAKAATEFIGFLRIMDKLVSIDQIKIDPLRTDVPTEAAVCYALVYALADSATKKDFAALVQYVDRLPKEFAFLFFRLIDQRHAELKRTKDFIQWTAKNHDFV